VDEIEVLRGDVEELGAAVDARVVHHHVDSTELAGRLDHRLDLRRVGNVGLNEHGGSATVLDGLGVGASASRSFGAARTSALITVAPASPNPFATARPIPLDAPVTTAVSPEKSALMVPHTDGR